MGTHLRFIFYKITNDIAKVVVVVNVRKNIMMN